MKKKVLAIALVTVFTGMGVAQAADVTAQAVATWSATAKKDTTSKLVVTPLGSLAFQYAEGIKGFNSQKGLFDVAIEGDSTATVLPSVLLIARAAVNCAPDRWMVNCFSPPASWRCRLVRASILNFTIMVHRITASATTGSHFARSPLVTRQDAAQPAARSARSRWW